jgi:hypothetical protein
MTQAIFGLVGAALGASVALTAAFLQNRNEALRRAADAAARRAEQDRRIDDRRLELARRYLFAFQEAVDSLCYRLENQRQRAGRSYAESKDPGYWATTTVYAVARALGAERLLSLDGIYPDLDALAGGREHSLRPRTVDDLVNRAIGRQLLFYHRLTLAESVLSRESDGWRVITYSEFRRRHDTPEWNLRLVADPAAEALDGLDGTRLTDFEEQLATLSARVTRVMEGHDLGA